MSVNAQNLTAAHDLIGFIDASPSPWHAVASAEARLLAQGYTRLEEESRWQLAAGGRYYVVRGGASMIAFVQGSKPITSPASAALGLILNPGESVWAPTWPMPTTRTSQTPTNPATK